MDYFRFGKGGKILIEFMADMRSSIVVGTRTLWTIGLVILCNSCIFGSHPKRKTDSMTILMPGKMDYRAVDSSHVRTTGEANVLRNIYSRLVVRDGNGDIVPQAATWKWDGDKLRFSLRKDFKTSKGVQVTAEDALLSLKRLIVLGKNTQGDLTNYVGTEGALKSVNEPCDGLFVDNGDLVFQFRVPQRGKFLLGLLASTDFSIIPSSAIRWELEGMPISDQSNTTGAYYLEYEKDAKVPTLIANQYFFDLHPEMPMRFDITTDHTNIDERFKSGQIGLLPTFDTPNLTFANDDFVKKNKVSTHQSLPIKLFVLHSKPAYFKRFSLESRKAIARMFRLNFDFSMLNSASIRTLEFFPKLSEGSLTAAQQESIKRIDDRPLPEFKSNKHAVLAVGTDSFDFMKKAFRNVSKIDVIANDLRLTDQPESEQPDLIFVNTDSSFYEDISLISYNVEMGHFGMTRQEGKKWLADYMAIEDKGERLKKVRALHYKILEEGSVIPIAMQSYRAIANYPWDLSLIPKLYAGMPLWMIRKQKN